MIASACSSAWRMLFIVYDKWRRSEYWWQGSWSEVAWRSLGLSCASGTRTSTRKREWSPGRVSRRSAFWQTRGMRIRRIRDRRDLQGGHRVLHLGQVLKRVQVAPLKPSPLRRSAELIKWWRGRGCHPFDKYRHPVALRPYTWSLCTVRLGERAALEREAQCKNFWRWPDGLRVSGRPPAPRPLARQGASPRRFPRPVGDGDRPFPGTWQEVARIRLPARARLS